MATLVTPIQFKELQVGSASTFRSSLNNNFLAINEYLETFDTGTKIIVSSTQPAAGTLKPGGFWYKVL